MAKKSAIERWKGGMLRVYAPGPARFITGPRRAKRFRPIGGGLAVVDGPLSVRIDSPDELRGIALEFDVRDERLGCVAITSGADGPEITSRLLRRLEPKLTEFARELFAHSVVRLIVLDDGKTIAGEEVWQEVTGGGVWFGTVSEDVVNEAANRTTRRGRPRLWGDDHYDRIAELYLEAERLGVAKTKYIASHYPNYNDETIRKWVQRARKDERLPARHPRKEGGR